MANDTCFELLAGADGATLCLQDHGMPMASAGLTGELTVLVGSEKSAAELKAVGANKLCFQGNKLYSDSTFIAFVIGVSGKAIAVHLTVKGYSDE
ncbi:MAG: hypothetical protein C0423_09075 [Methylibium sp.]|nr:hypothetical protein [Methylibium sp.]